MISEIRPVMDRARKQNLIKYEIVDVWLCAGGLGDKGNEEIRIDLCPNNNFSF